MSSWVLNCVNCRAKFEHSKAVEEDGLRYLQVPMKPQFPLGGSELVCPKCGHVAVYERTDLVYCQ